jgi:O-antigen/teichoic acid export membrane protein
VRSLRGQLSIATFGHGLEKLIALVVVTVLIRHVDKELMGQFFFAISVCTAAALLNEFGSARYLIRAVAQDRPAAASHLGGVLRFRLPLLAVTLAAINGVVAVTAPQLLWMFAFTSVYVLFDNLYYAFGSTLLGTGAIAARVATGLIAPLCLLVTVPLAALLGWPFERIVIIYAVAAVLMSVASFLLVVRRLGPIPVFDGAVPVRKIIAQCALLFAVNVTILLHARIDEWMLAAMRDFREVAGYAAAYKLAEVSRTAIRPVAMVLFPLFAAAVADLAWREVRTHARRALAGAALIGATVAACVIAVAPWVVPLLFGQEYPESVSITRVLFLVTPALFVSSVAMTINTSLHLERETLVFAVASVALNFALNLVAIPRWGALGAAWSTLVTETLFCVSIVALVATTVRTRAARTVQSG